MLHRLRQIAEIIRYFHVAFAGLLFAEVAFCFDAVVVLLAVFPLVMIDACFSLFGADFDFDDGLTLCDGTVGVAAFMAG